LSSQCWVSQEKYCVLFYSKNDKILFVKWHWYSSNFHTGYLRLWQSDTKVLLLPEVRQTSYFAFQKVLLRLLLGISQPKIFFLWGWFLLQGIDCDAWREIRERGDAELHHSAICRQVFDTASSVKLLAANYSNVFFTTKLSWKSGKFIPFIMHSTLHKLRSFYVPRSTV